jgi:hypothetical protein
MRCPSGRSWLRSFMAVADSFGYRTLARAQRISTNYFTWERRRPAGELPLRLPYVILHITHTRHQFRPRH